jgi:hypothetical protein
MVGTSGQNKQGEEHRLDERGYKEERVLVGCEDVSCCAISLNLFTLALTMPDLVKKQVFPTLCPEKGINCLFQL